MRLKSLYALVKVGMGSSISGVRNMYLAGVQTAAMAVRVEMSLWWFPHT
jgi:hypothetical protein